MLLAANKSYLSERIYVYVLRAYAAQVRFHHLMKTPEPVRIMLYSFVLCLVLIYTGRAIFVRQCFKLEMTRIP